MSASLSAILNDHWSRVEPLLDRRFPPDVAAAVRSTVPKTIRCGTPESGYVRYRCAECGAFHTICFSCKSRFCPTCGPGRAAEAAESRASDRGLRFSRQRGGRHVPSGPGPTHPRCSDPLKRLRASARLFRLPRSRSQSGNSASSDARNRSATDGCRRRRET